MRKPPMIDINNSKLEGCRPIGKTCLMTHYSAGASWSKGATAGMTSADPLEDQALALLDASFPLHQGGARGMLENLSDTLVGLG